MKDVTKQDSYRIYAYLVERGPSTARQLSADLEIYNYERLFYWLHLMEREGMIDSFTPEGAWKHRRFYRAKELK